MQAHKRTTELQEKILKEARENPHSTYKEIADKVECSISYVSETLRKFSEDEGRLFAPAFKLKQGTDIPVEMTQSEWFRVVSVLLHNAEDETSTRLAQKIATQALEDNEDDDANNTIPAGVTA